MHSLLLADLPADLLRDDWLPRTALLCRQSRMADEEPLREDAQAAWLTPAERWLMQALGLPQDAEQAPWARLAAAADGLTGWAADAPGLGLLTPAHLRLGRDSLTLDDPGQLGLTEEHSRALFEAAEPVFAQAGWSVRRATARRWYAAHVSLADVVSAAPARARGRGMAAWMPAGPAARPWRQVLTEVQMTWQHHPANAEREELGLPEVNTLWLHGCGPLDFGWCSPLRAAEEAPDAAGEDDWGALLRGLSLRACDAADAQLRVINVPRQLAEMSEQPGDPLDAFDVVLSDAMRAALSTGAAVRLVLAGTLHWRSVEVSHSAAWRFWRRATLQGLAAGL